MKIKTIKDSDVTEVADLKFPKKDGNHVVQSIYADNWGIKAARVYHGKNRSDDQIKMFEHEWPKNGKVIAFDTSVLRMHDYLAAHTQSLRMCSHIDLVGTTYLLFSCGPEVGANGNDIPWGQTFGAFDAHITTHLGDLRLANGSMPGRLLGGFDDLFSKLSHGKVLTRLDFAVSPNYQTITFMMADSDQNVAFAAYDMYDVACQQAFYSGRYDAKTNTFGYIPKVDLNKAIVSGFVPRATWESVSQNDLVKDTKHYKHVSFQGVSRANSGTLYLASQFGPHYIVHRSELIEGLTFTQTTSSIICTAHSRGIYKIPEKGFIKNNSDLWTYYQLPMTGFKIDMWLSNDDGLAVTELEDVQVVNDDELYLAVAYHEPDGEFTTIANKVFKVKLR